MLLLPDRTGQTHGGRLPRFKAQVKTLSVEIDGPDLPNHHQLLNNTITDIS